MSGCLEGLDGRVTMEMNSKLLANFTPEEVEEALKQMHPFKSLGPNGFAVGFYQGLWPIVGLEVYTAMLDFLSSGTLDPAINNTFIALIPKKNDSICVTDYHPISSCNMAYKLGAKVLANRLKMILPHIVSPFQSAGKVDY